MNEQFTYDQELSVINFKPENTTKNTNNFDFGIIKKNITNNPPDFNEQLKNKTVQICKKCNNENVHYDINHGSIVCLNCGEYNGSVMTDNTDWQSYNKSKTNGLKDDNRCSRYSLSYNTQKIYIQGLHQQSLINKIHMWSEVSYRKKNMNNIKMYIINKFKNVINKKTCDDAFNLYKDVYHKTSNSKDRIYRGNVRHGVIGACVYFASKQNNEIITAIEIATIIGIKKTIVLSGYKKVNNLLHEHNLSETTNTPSKPNDFVDKYCDILNVNEGNREIIGDIITNLCKHNFALQNNPKTIVTSSIFLVSCIYDIGLSKKDISEKCQISQVTIYKCFISLLNNIDKFINISALTQNQTNNLNKLQSRSNHKAEKG